MLMRAGKNKKLMRVHKLEVRIILSWLGLYRYWPGVDTETTQMLGMFTILNGLVVIRVVHILK